MQQHPKKPSLAQDNLLQQCVKYLTFQHQRSPREYHSSEIDALKVLLFEGQCVGFRDFWLHKAMQGKIKEYNEIMGEIAYWDGTRETLEESYDAKAFFEKKKNWKKERPDEILPTDEALKWHFSINPLVSLFETVINNLQFLQEEYVLMEPKITNADMPQKMKIIKGEGIETLFSVLRIGFVFTREELASLLGDIAKSDRFLSLSTDEHTTGLYCQAVNNETLYIFFDSNDPNGSIAFNSIEQLINGKNGIVEQLGKSFNYDVKKNIPLEISVFSRNPKEKTAKQSMIISKNL